ncbi:MAG: 7-cyano-7-deazaguanine synthase QueC [Candidatus Delongbacteria bacterium]|nr:7-cyano-7-deazaguanine synthase QueC [Candidatus Delongbacteria bacterium]
MPSDPAAVVLLSGGLDSTTCLAIARKQGYRCHALSFDYGQRHRLELDCASRVARAMGAERHLVSRIDLAAFGGSALTSGIDVPKSESAEAVDQHQGVPITYVPARNTIFLSFALAWCEVLGASHIFIGVNALDFSGYPDCRPEYIQAWERLARLATRAGVEGQELVIHTPLMQWDKSRIISEGLALGVDYALTTTCYDPDAAGLACGHCDACLLRLRGFRRLGVTDPAGYQPGARP